ncbi:hypothetical protein BXZ70DRAFT_1008210 [Cristinia sonorae]|uniref:TECPR1-like DysF domain-containing protein n=1 Tax=Cristinia sonorae TaxID=1940300 RepID=A0A8K0UQ13_9AGAR|nr:hypothetical protein BXZ70DRAFT_1008210 [Cristinia sonorae]
MSSSRPPPECMRQDDPAAADHARRRLLPKRSFLSNILPSRRRPQKSRDSNLSAASVPSPVGERDAAGSPELPAGTMDDLVHLQNRLLSEEAPLEEDYSKDVYRWAVLYENQRGLTFFSTPYYSPLSLLPMDPPPFTIPSASKSPRAGQPTVSLSSYPLPDGTWRWVSRTWMVDMRGDGQTQYDGFQYNWFFRGKHWRAEVGHLSSGGWVRRRRWVRLMMRPAQAVPTLLSPRPDNTPQPSDGGATRPPSVISVGNSSMDEADPWEGDASEDWARCRNALRKVRDGKKVELWKSWLGHPRPITLSPRHSTPDLGKTIRIGGPAASQVLKGDGEDMASSPAPAPRERVATILRQHGSDILQSFVYPDSRAQFVELLAQVGLLPELQTNPGSPGPLAMLEFWSYASSMDKLPTLDGSPKLD